MEGLAGSAEATQVCSGSRGTGHPPREGLGVRGPKSRVAAAFKGACGSELDAVTTAIIKEKGKAPKLEGKR